MMKFYVLINLKVKLNYGNYPWNKGYQIMDILIGLWVYWKLLL